jgi:hypothetical protein
MLQLLLPSIATKEFREWRKTCLINTDFSAPALLITLTLCIEMWQYFRRKPEDVILIPKNAARE